MPATASSSRSSPTCWLPPPPAPAAVHLREHRGGGPRHRRTRGAAARGAEADQVLEVRHKALELNYAGGYTPGRPRAGPLPDDFHEARGPGDHTSELQSRP